MKKLIFVMAAFLGLTLAAAAQSGGTYRNFYWYGDFENDETDQLFYYEVDGERCGWYLSLETASILMDNPKWISSRNWADLWLGADVPEARATLESMLALLGEGIGATGTFRFIASTDDMAGPLSDAAAVVGKSPVIPLFTVVRIDFPMQPYAQAAFFDRKELKFFLKKLPKAEKRRVK